MSFIVAIDGPSGSGKGTVAKELAKKHNLINVDSGAAYRCVTLEAINQDIKIKELKQNKEEMDKLSNIIKNIDIQFENNDGNIITYLNGKDVSKKIREEIINKNIIYVAPLDEVRDNLNIFFRKFAQKNDIIMDGRDIGTEVFPNADVKIYLDASPEERAKRRIKQNKEQNINLDVSYEEILKDINKRDEEAINRKKGALKQAENAIYIDSTKLSINRVVSNISKIIKRKKTELARIEKGYIFPKETVLKRIRRKCLKVFLASLYHLAFRVKKINIQNIEKEEGFIICSNHVNYLDAAGIILLNKKEITFVCKDDLYRFKSLSHLGHLFNIIPVKRNSSDLSSIKLCLKALKENKALGIFPEGTRNGLKKQADVKNGAVFLAHKAKVKIVPVGVSGTFKPFSKVVFNYGEPIDLTKYDTSNLNWMDKATDDMMNEIVRLTNNVDI